MSESALPALPHAARSALLAGNRRLAVALVRQANGLGQDEAGKLVERHLARSPALSTPLARLDRTTAGWAVLVGVAALGLYLVLHSA